MNAIKKIASIFITVAFLITIMILPASATESGDASIGFSAGGIYYIPMGISGVNPNLDLDFGTHDINISTTTQTYASRNTIGYAVANKSGGANAYRLTLGLSSFDNGLQGASLTLYPDAQGMITDIGFNQNAPILMEGLPSMTLEADGQGSVTIFRSTTSFDNPNHTGLGNWGCNFESDLKVYTSTVLRGRSKAVMTWELTIA